MTSQNNDYYIPGTCFICKQLIPEVPQAFAHYDCAAALESHKKAIRQAQWQEELARRKSKASRAQLTKEII